MAQAHTQAIQKKDQGSKFDHKQDSGYRRTCNVALTSTAAGETWKPVVVGKERGFGKDEEASRAWKLRDLRDWVLPGLGKLSDHLDIHSNESGFFDTVTYSSLVLDGSVCEHANTDEEDEWSLGLHDAALTHKGKVEEKEADGSKRLHYLHKDAESQPCELKDWLKARHVVEGNIPPGWKSKRPNDQRIYNFIFRWRYDEVIAELGGKSDFRQAACDTDVKHVLAAIALTVQWMNAHCAP